MKKKNPKKQKETEKENRKWLLLCRQSWMHQKRSEFSPKVLLRYLLTPARGRGAVGRRVQVHSQRHRFATVEELQQ